MSLVAPMKIVKVVSDKDFGYECKCVDNTCVDINEGTTDNSCPENFSCLNTLGSFNCNCLDGFKMNSNGACNDINEYTLGTNDCNSNGDDVSCNDIDECNDGSDTCGDNSICSNTVGSFTGGCVNGYPLQQENWENLTSAILILVTALPTLSIPIVVTHVFVRLDSMVMDFRATMSMNVQTLTEVLMMTFVTILLAVTTVNVK